jgi:hypothetical protein
MPQPYSLISVFPDFSAEKFELMALSCFSFHPVSVNTAAVFMVEDKPDRDS